MKRCVRALGAMSLAAVLGLSALGAQAKTITVWCWDAKFNGAIMKEAAERYTKTHPDITFDVHDVGNDNSVQKLLTTLASGNTAALPDIVLIEDYNAQKFLTSFPGAFASLAGVVDASAFAPYKIAPLTVEGTIYGMPFDSGVAGMFYRKDYLEAAGFKPSDLENITWARFIEIGKVVEAKTGKKMLAFEPTSPISIFRVMLQSAGGWYFDKDGSAVIEGNGPLQATLETYAKLVASSIYRPTAGWAEYVKSVSSGEVATVISGVWIAGTIKSATDQSGKWSVAPIPALEYPGAGHASNWGGSSWYVLESSKAKAEAVDFLGSTFGKDVDFYNSILKSYGAVGTLLAAQESPAYQLPDPFFGGDAIFAKFAEWLPKVPVVNFGSFTPEVEAAVGSELPNLFAGKPIQDVLAGIRAQVETRIQQ